jgi:rubrerythrin
VNVSFFSVTITDRRRNMATTQEELESLNTAIKTEKDGRAFYQEAAKRSTNPMAKAVFRHLAEEERSHIDIIQAYYDQMKERGTCAGLEDLIKDAPSVKEDLKNVFQKACQEFDQRVEIDADSLKAYETAMKLEGEAYDMYKRLQEHTEDCMARNLFQFMLEQENEHFAFLKETHDYLENPADWFVKEERPHFEG